MTRISKFYLKLLLAFYKSPDRLVSFCTLLSERWRFGLLQIFYQITAKLDIRVRSSEYWNFYESKCGFRQNASAINLGRHNRQIKDVRIKHLASDSIAMSGLTFKPRPCPFIQILSRFYPDFILILSKFYPDKIRIKFG